MSPQNSFLVIDGNHIVRTIDEANPAPASRQKAAQTMKNAASTFRRVMAEFKPTHALVAFDNPGRTWRHDLYSHYRQGRTPMSAELRDAMETFFRSLPQSFGISAVTIEGQEADDVIASAVTKWQERRCRSQEHYQDAVVLTADKDLLQLLPLGARIRNVFKNIWYDEEYVAGKMAGITSSQVRDYLALVGDTSDSVPGVSGWGSKTAATYLSQYGTLEHLIQQAHEVPGRAGVLLRENIESAKLSYRLVGLDQSVTLGLTWAQIRVNNATHAEMPKGNLNLFERPATPTLSTLPPTQAVPARDATDRSVSHTSQVSTPISQLSTRGKPEKFVDSLIFGGV